MKKTLLTAAALIALSTTAQAETNFQKVYEVPGMNASEIQQALGDTTIDVGVDNLSKWQDIQNTMNGEAWKTGDAKTGKLRCNIAMASWMPDVNEWFDANVAFQVKDNKARVTLADIKVYGPGKKTCIKSIEKHLDARFSMLKKLDSNW